MMKSKSAFSFFHRFQRPFDFHAHKRQHVFFYKINPFVIARSKNGFEVRNYFFVVKNHFAQSNFCHWSVHIHKTFQKSRIKFRICPKLQLRDFLDCSNVEFVAAQDKMKIRVVEKLVFF